ncbi:MAG: hypothetical protein WD064_01485, partial [Acidimicrobiia bacterium]
MDDHKTATWSMMLFPIGAVALLAANLGRVNWDPLEVLIAAAGLGLGMQFKVPASSGNPFAPGLAVGAAAPIFFREGETTALAAVLVVYAVGLLLGWLLLLARNDQTGLDEAMLRRLLGLTAYALVFAWIRNLEVGMVSDEWRVAPPLLAGTVVWFLVEAMLWVQFRIGPRELSRRYLTRALLSDVNVFVSLIATGALFALASASLSIGALWAVGVAGLPYMFAHSAFRRFQTIRRTYRQTIRALARIPEVAGLGTDGHADRTVELALAVGKDLGLSRSEMDDLEYAALMHDIGRITLTEPAILR